MNKSKMSKSKINPKKLHGILKELRKLKKV